MFAARRKWVVVGARVVLALAVVLLVRTFGSNPSDDLELPGTDSQAATDLLAERFPPQQNGSSPIVFHVDKGRVTNSKNQQAIEDSHQAIVKLPHVASATDPFSQQGASQISKDKGTAFIRVLLVFSGDELTEEIAQEAFDHPGVHVRDVASDGPADRVGRRRLACRPLAYRPGRSLRHRADDHAHARPDDRPRRPH
jgi:hypothetical protein